MKTCTDNRNGSSSNTISSKVQSQHHGHVSGSTVKIAPDPGKNGKGGLRSACYRRRSFDNLPSSSSSEFNQEAVKQAKSKRRGSFLASFFKNSSSRDLQKGGSNRKLGFSNFRKISGSSSAGTISTSRSPHTIESGGNSVDGFNEDSLHFDVADVSAPVTALVNGTPVLELPTEDYIIRLETMAQQEEIDGELDNAIETWAKVLQLRDLAGEKMRVRCKLAMLLLKLDTEESDDEAAKVLSQTDHDLVRANIDWLQPSSGLLNILVDQKSWKLAMVIAQQLPLTPDHIVAKLNYEMAMLMIEAHSFRLADEHLMECHKLLRKSDEQNLQVLDLWGSLAAAYADRGRYEEALEFYEKRCKYLTSSSDIAACHYAKAITVYVPLDDLERALEEVALGLEVIENASSPRDTNSQQDLDDSTIHGRDRNDSTSVSIKLLQLKADILCRFGEIDQCLYNYEQVVHRMERKPRQRSLSQTLKCPGENTDNKSRISNKHSVADIANVLYTMGRVCVHAKRFVDAISYFNRELELTRAVVGNCHLAVSRVLHELAKVSEKGLMDYEQALRYYKETLEVETAVLQQCVRDMQSLPCCKNFRQSGNSRGRCRVPTSANFTKYYECCPKHVALMTEAKQQIIETKRCLGRLHFMHGDFDSAVKTSFDNARC